MGKIMDFPEVTAMFRDDMSRVEKCLRDNYLSDIPLVPGIGDYIMSGGGKRIRPLLLLISNRLLGQKLDDRVVRHACVVEYVHAATLLHDDVVDETTVRRGKETVNSKWGSDASILVGDFLIARALLMLSDDIRDDIFKVFAESAKTLVEGGLLEFTHARDIHVTETHILDVVQRKTASMMALSCQLGGMLAQAEPEKSEALRDFGIHFGNAFQLMDDILDYEGTEEQLGKPPGTDFKEGHVTLPLHYLYHQSDRSLQSEIEGFIQNENLTGKEFDYILERMREAKATDYVLDMARSSMEKAKETIRGQEFAEPQYIDALFAVADYMVNRHQSLNPALTSSR